MGVDPTFGFGFSSSASLCINSLVDLASSMLFFCLFLENRKAMVSGKTAGSVERRLEFCLGFGNAAARLQLLPGRPRHAMNV